MRTERQQTLWAPWRMEYILEPKPEGCFLCDLAAQPPGAESLLIVRRRGMLVCLNKYPYNNGHLLVAPERHVGELDDLMAVERAALMEVTNEALGVVRRLMQPAGFNLGVNLGDCAGAGLREHVHMHVVPRWTGDTNFMPVLAETKVIPQHLATLRAALVAAWEG